MSNNQGGVATRTFSDERSGDSKKLKTENMGDTVSPWTRRSEKKEEPKPRKMRGRRRLPHRWINFNPVGKDIPGTRFVAFKTPLQGSFFGNIGRRGFSSHRIFMPKTLVELALAQRKRIGLVIDLTNTFRYYDPREWKEFDIEYKKLRCRGHGVHEDEDTVKAFFTTVTEFLRRNAQKDALIGVHCTHGLNRTGYMICRYLIEVDGWDPATAIDQFEQCRGYKVERRTYIDSLLNDCIRACMNEMAVEYPGKRKFREIESSESL